MSAITSLTLSDVRCFDGAQIGKTPRITVLVGENSTGKSTFLGCYRAFAQVANLIELDDDNYFDQSPFFMGPFETIARTGCKAFGISGTFSDHSHQRVHIDYRLGPNAMPAEQMMDLHFSGVAGEDTRLRILADDRLPQTWSFEGPEFRFDLDQRVVSYRHPSTWLSRLMRYGYLPFGGNPATLRKQNPSVSIEQQVAFGRWVSFMRSALPFPSTRSFETLALEPESERRNRSYSFDPLAGASSDFLRRLQALGARLGLFSGLRVARANGHFEVTVETGFGWRNIMDVGYGVHSVLGLLRAMCDRVHPVMFLLQQPEVHLHPVAQAELAQIMAESRHGFLIETHSDHFVDRLRICAMQGIIDPEEFGIIYFEPSEDRSRSCIHSISVDLHGNLHGEPDSYRTFFLKETERLLGLAD